MQSSTILSLRELFFSRSDGKLSDKWSSYLFLYEKLFSEIRMKPVSILEIGVQNGGSLEIWSQYFPNAKSIIGVDVDTSCAQLQFSDSRIVLEVGSITCRDVQQRIICRSPQLDLIIDDGSHKSDDVVSTFLDLFPKLAYDGLYVIEDLHTSYWREYGGGLRQSNSSMSFFKRLTDVINQEHWNCGLSAESYIEAFDTEKAMRMTGFPFADIHSAFFANSVCVVTKRASEANRLGCRISSGKDAPIAAFGHFDPPTQS